MTRTPSRQVPWAEPIWQVAPHTLESLAAGFAPISLQQMEAVALLNRVDTKFVMRSGQLLSALAELQSEYWMLSIDGQRLNHYRTLYFDTPDFALYHAHVNERAERYKVRSREYLDTRVSYLEVKQKTRKARTIKQRIPTERPVEQMTPELESWLRSVSALEGGELEPKLWNTFRRLTLVGKRGCERVTLDVDLVFAAGDQVVALEGVVIAEVKMETSERDSAFVEQMRAQRIRALGFSKYAMGVSMLYEQVKKNALKSKLLWVEKVMKGDGAR
jgi:hypothetical protein